VLTEGSVENDKAAVETLEENGAFKGREFPVR
jgi:hypothetical protein